MSHKNIEIKARCRSERQAEMIRAVLKEHNAEFRGVDHQTDTYFRVPNGRLKLRQGNIENSLVQYDRPDQAGPKQADVNLHHPAGDIDNLYATLEAALGILVVVCKQREIYFVDNVKFHIDTVETLGDFVEIEAIDSNGTHTCESLERQCRDFMVLFGIQEQDLLTNSYSDMLLQR